MGKVRVCVGDSQNEITVDGRGVGFHEVDCGVPIVRFDGHNDPVSVSDLHTIAERLGMYYHSERDRESAIRLDSM